MSEEESTYSIALDSEPKDKLETGLKSSHVTLRQKGVTEFEFPFNRTVDSVALSSVYRYTRRIRKFLGWESFREDLDVGKNFCSENLSLKENTSSNNSQEELALSEEQNKDNFGHEKNSVHENLSVGEEFYSNDNELAFSLEYDINIYKEEYKNNEKFDTECRYNNNNRSSYYLDIKNFSDYAFESQNVSKQFNDNIRKNIIRTSGEHFECKQEIYRSEFNLDVDDSKTDKKVLIFNSDVDGSINENKNIDMDKILLQENGLTHDGLMLNDENAILEDENAKTIFNTNERNLENDEKYLQDFIPKGSIEINTDILQQEIKCEKSLRNTGIENTEVEGNKNLLNEKLIDKAEEKRSIYEENEELVEPQNGDFIEKVNNLELFKTFVNTDKCKNSINNNAKEKKENKATNSKLSIPIKAHIQYKDEKIKEKQNFEDLDKDTSCGLGIFRPQWLQSCATAKVYVILYSILGILHGSYYTYLVGTLSTLEKRFAFKSKISGAIMVADEITPLLLGVFVGYYASKAHRPRIVALGMLLSAGCSFVSSLPYFIYGSTENLVFSDVINSSGSMYCDPGGGTESCDSDRPQNLLAVLFLIFGSFLKGFGNLAYYAIGLAYLDDNSDKKNTPIYLAIALALRLLGPLVGFLMSSGFLKYYENPVYDPGFGPDDPRWIGAWWIGFFLQGILLVIFSIPIAFFPRRLPSQKKIEKVADTTSEDGFKSLFTGLLSALKRLGKNPVFIVLIINTTMKIFGHFGHAIMLPKYMENQFRLSASEASLFSGAITVVCIIISTILGGFLIWKFRPKIKVILAGMIVAETILCVGFLILMIPRCQISEMLHFGMNEDGLILNSVCNKNCDCSTSSFTPFCGPDGKTLYFSPCYAGCTDEISSSSKMIKEYGNCSCVDQQQLGTTITEGFCPDENCSSQMIFYLIILFLLVTISNLFTVAATMILLRSVHPNDKSVALGTFETFICLFGFIPFPVIYGALVDSACLVWEKSCGETGNCWFYDMEKYDYLLHGASALFCSFSVVCLITLYFLSPRIRSLYDEEEEEKKEETDKYIDIKLDTVSGTVSVTKL